MLFTLRGQKVKRARLSMIYRGKSDHYIQSITRIKRFEIIVIVIEKKKKASEMEVSWVVPIGTKQ